MRHSIVYITLVFFSLYYIGSTYSSERPRSKRIASQSGPNAKNVTRRVLDAGRLAMNVTDRGYIAEYTFLANDTIGWHDAGSYWLYSPRVGYPWWPQGVVLTYDQGPWVIGKLNGKPAASVTDWAGSFMPGPIIDGLPALDMQPQDSLRYHPYRISLNNEPEDAGDYLNWPEDLGAPVDSEGHPKVLGDQLVWCIYNGADSTVWPTSWWPQSHFPRLPVEVQQSIYTHRASGLSDTSLLANVIFIEWTFINKGSETVDSCYLGLWNDMDIDPGASYPAVDTALDLGYCWTKDAPHAGDQRPRAAGYVLLYGPVVPDPLSTAMVRGQARPGYRNLGLSSFFGFCSDVGPDSDAVAGPTNINAAWNLARGMDKLGQPFVDPTRQQVTHFPYGGDPVSGTGWLWSGGFGFEEGFLMYSGPFTFAPGDTQWMLTALIPGDSTEYTQSITGLRQYARRLRAMTYDQISSQHNPDDIDLHGGNPALPQKPELMQNYPNPFNPSTVIPYALPKQSHVIISVYNALGQHVAELVNGEVEAGYHEIEFNASDLASGVYFYRFQTDGFIHTRKLCIVR